MEAEVEVKLLSSVWPKPLAGFVASVATSGEAQVAHVLAFRLASPPDTLYTQLRSLDSLLYVK